MNDINTNKTALVTGATSGLGFEAAVHLAEAGYAKVIITGRSDTRVETARRELVARTGRDVFGTVTLDLSNTASVRQAGAALAARQETIDFALLNAGMVSGSDLVRTDEGIEITFASSLIGHHQLTMQLLADEMLADDARIVIAGSEAARGDVPTFNPVMLQEFAAKHYHGDMVAAASDLIRGEGPMKYKPASVYANAKLFVAYWAAELAEKLPDGTTVNAVSPGSAPGTDAGRNANFFMRYIMLPVIKLMPGMSADVPVAARRYIEASEFPGDVTGEFFASAPKKMTGRLHRVDLPHVQDRVSSRAAWQATVAVAGGVDYPVVV